MKKLSIEEKAKRYDEAIEKAESIYNETVIPSATTKGICTYIFPELKESEDERIKGNIIATIHLYYGEPLEDEAKEMIAWLEKQGKNNMGISEATKQKLEDNLNKALEQETPDSWNEFLEKQGEQKPTDDIERKYNPCYNMSFEEAQEYISNRGFETPWTDCDVFVDFRYVTQTIANILCWADSNPITAADRGIAEEIIINLKRIEHDYRIDLTKEMEWLRNKTQKGK